MKIKNITTIEKILPIITSSSTLDEKIIVVSCNYSESSLYLLKNHIGFQYNVLSCISGVDYLKSDYRFGVIYDVLSLKFNNRLRIKVFLNETTPVYTAVNVYINADWWEREVWDMYGVYFTNHPDLRRILTDYGFEGFPMRKDFPLSGYIETKYDVAKKRIVLEPVQLSQEYRTFSFDSPWSLSI